MTRLERMLKITDPVVLVPIVGFFVLWTSLAYRLPLFLQPPPAPSQFLIVALIGCVIVVAQILLTIADKKAKRRDAEREVAWRTSVATVGNARAAIKHASLLDGEVDGAWNEAARLILLELLQEYADDDELPEFLTGDIIGATNTALIVPAHVPRDHNIDHRLALELVGAGWLTSTEKNLASQHIFRLSDRFLEEYLYPHCREQEERRRRLELDETHMYLDFDPHLR